MELILRLLLLYWILFIICLVRFIASLYCYLWSLLLFIYICLDLSLSDNKLTWTFGLNYLSIGEDYVLNLYTLDLKLLLIFCWFVELISLGYTGLYDPGPAFDSFTSNIDCLNDEVLKGAENYEQLRWLGGLYYPGPGILLLLWSVWFFIDFPKTKAIKLYNKSRYKL